MVLVLKVGEPFRLPHFFFSEIMTKCRTHLLVYMYFLEAQ